MFKFIKSFILILLSVLLLGIGMWFAGVERVILDLMQFQAWVVATVLIFFAINFIFVTFRLICFLDFFNINVLYSVAFKATLNGHMGSLFFISLFGQVAGRYSILRYYGSSPVSISALTGIERALVFFVSGIFCLIGASFILDKEQINNFIDKFLFYQIFFVAFISFILSMWFRRSKLEVRFIKGIVSKKNISLILRIIFITIFAQGLILGAFAVAAKGLSPEIGFVSLLAAAAITSFAASLPISVNGWGVREIAAIFAFGKIGMPSSTALAISILVGLCSTAIILIQYPYVFNKNKEIFNDLQHLGPKHDRLFIEKIVTWGLVLASAIFIFFQLHISLEGGVLNFNLADALAILALAAVVLHIFYSRQLPYWSIPKFNLLLLVVSILLIFSFFNGLHTIGVTQWALAGRLFGWFILLGYLSIGILTVSYLGREGVWRFVESLIATAIVVILFSAVMRWLVFLKWIIPTVIIQNFEGYSGNRNAFAFQLLSCSVLIIAYLPSKISTIKKVIYGFLHIQLIDLLAFVHGIVLAGVVFTGSRAGIITGILLLLASVICGFINLKILFKSIVFGSIVWVFFVSFLPWLSQLFSGEVVGVASSGAGELSQHLVQSVISNEVSNLERWQTFLRGFEMWRNSPWFGAGLGVFIESSPKWFSQPMVIHSTPIWILAEFGIFGMGILVGSLGWMIFWIKKSGFDNPSNRAVIMLLLIFLVFGLAHEIFYQRIFWLVLGICLALPSLDHSFQLSKRNQYLR